MGCGRAEPMVGTAILLFIEPTMELYGPYAAQFAFRVYRAIDWTHMHRKQTYDVLSHTKIPWSERKEWADRAVRYYLDKTAAPPRWISPCAGRL